MSAAKDKPEAQAMEFIPAALRPYMAGRERIP